MLTLDSWLVARLAKDLDASLRGARIQSVQAGATELILFCYRRGTHVALQASADSNAPMVAARELDEPQVGSGAVTWAGSVAALLRGAAIDAVHALPSDRVLYVDVSSRSAFGVPSRSRIVIELQPRKANALVLRHAADDSWIVVAAAKQFDRASDARSVTIGALYEPPPPRSPRVDRAQFILLSAEVAGGDRERFTRLLGEYDPECTPPLGREVIARVAAAGAGRINARALLDAWAPLRREVEEALEESREVFVTRIGGVVTACHLVPLSWPASAAGDDRASATAGGTVSESFVKTVNELCVEALRQRPTQRSGPAPEALGKRLATLLSRCEEEAKSLERARSAAHEAAQLREAGDEIYAHLTEIEAGAPQIVTLDGRRIALDPLLTPKENAAEYFRKYKKARSGLPRIEARLRALRANREYWEQLQWETGRADGLPPVQREQLLAEIADAVGIKEQRKRSRGVRAQEEKVELGGGAAAYVGRSPRENERLTFAVAAPNDYWFHARGIPGAHVIVKTGGAQITRAQIQQAAGLAAGHSRGAQATNVEVDYTQRKHVRRHSSGKPGLVWYTDFETVRVAPKSRDG